MDVSKDALEVAFSTLDMDRRVKVKASGKFANTPTGFKQLQRWLESKRSADAKLRLLLEATGVYYEQLAWFLYGEGYQVSVVLPTKAKRYLQAVGNKSKNDKIDARGLAQMGLEQRLELWQPLSKNIYRLRLLTRQLEDFTGQRTVCLNQLHALHHGALVVKQVERNLHKLVRTLDKSLQELEEAIRELLYQDPLLAQRVDKLLAETNGFATFERQGQLVSYAGYDVVEHQSGLRAGRTKISKKGNAHIWRAMHMPALGVVRFQEPRFVALYEWLGKKGKTKMQAYVAVQRKLLVLLWTLWRKNEAYDPRYGKQPAEPKKNIQLQEARASLSGVSEADKDPSTQETEPQAAEKEIAPAQARALAR